MEGTTLHLHYQIVPGALGPVSLFLHRRNIGKLAQVQLRAGVYEAAAYGIWTRLTKINLSSLKKKEKLVTVSQ